jgi:hypothetical protein
MVSHQSLGTLGPQRQCLPQVSIVITGQKDSQPAHPLLHLSGAAADRPVLLAAEAAEGRTSCCGCEPLQQEETWAGVLQVALPPLNGARGNQIYGQQRSQHDTRVA